MVPHELDLLLRRESFAWRNREI